MLNAPPIFMQVLVPSTLTNPAPYSAQALAEFGRFNGSTFPEGAALPDFGGRGCSATTAPEDRTSAVASRRSFRMPPFTATRRLAPARQI